ncbi:MAG TPA: ShlB/FhaC/HecB family hemolysin secretion/activation protein [Noviherbaspirillum sp.]|jgi:hemolysin activation/secretion protein|uniref:ShlB/FhaC/HecB family hemolysin secretion/activation protein n=1 Tax=Noviherbaspirillum sp. TaxID=1926288 RepID=UPI002F93901E
MLFRLKPSVILTVMALAHQAHAQQLPDASVLYPETQPRLAPPPASPAFKLDGGALPAGRQGGEKFELKEVRFQGNTVLPGARLEDAVRPYIGKPVDLAGLQDVANAVSAAYRAAGYPFARAYLPRQDVANGVVVLDVVEGRFGEVAATVGDGSAQRTSAEAQAYLGTMKTGEVMAAAEIERAALIMNDLPGYTAIPIVRPGATLGSGDLEMRLVEEERLRASVGVDNHGSRYTGLYRTRVDVARTRNVVFGDELRLTGLLTDGKTGMVHVGYGLPLMPNGLRMDLSAVHSQYELTGGWMTGEGFNGKADIVSSQVSYPVLRSQSANLSLAAAAQHKRYTNEIGARERYNVNALPLTMNFDVRDQLNGGGLTYGALAVQAARVGNDNIDNPERDREFSKLNLDLVRVQRITDRVQASIKASGQHTDDNIDSTEFISISGPYAVRAFPIGEFSGHRGWSAQAEVSYNLPQYHLAPYLFYDEGQAVNTTTRLRRTLAGYGIGARYAHDGWGVDLVAAWARTGKPSEVEPHESGARFWVSVSKRF